MAAVTLAAAASVQAAPVTYQFVTGTAFVTLSRGGTDIGSASLALDGIFAEFDDGVAESAPPTLVDFEFTTAPNQPVDLSEHYGFYDQVVLNASSMTPGFGYTHIFSGGSAGEYFVTVAPVHSDVVYSASDSGGVYPPVFNVPDSFDHLAPLTATINVNAGTFTLLGLTLFTVNNPFDDETEDLIVKADLTFEGMTPVPEPGTLVLAGLALAALAGRRLLSF